MVQMLQALRRYLFTHLSDQNFPSCFNVFRTALFCPGVFYANGSQFKPSRKSPRRFYFTLAPSASKVCNLPQKKYPGFSDDYLKNNRFNAIIVSKITGSMRLLYLIDPINRFFSDYAVISDWRVIYGK